MNQPDVTIMYAVHRPFRRDLARMQNASAEVHKSAVHNAVRDCWATFHRYLVIHHSAEDEMLWPPLRRKLQNRSDTDGLLDQMLDEHRRLSPLLQEIDVAVRQASSTRLPVLFAELAELLCDHFDHEEKAVLPLVRQTLTTREWNAFGNDQRRRIGFRGAAWFFPWLLDEAAPDTRDFVLSLVPPPVRLVHLVLWEPRYRRASPW